MRDPNRIDVFCSELAAVWHKVPDWRFGQLVANVLGRDPFYIEDEDAMAFFHVLLEKEERHASDGGNVWDSD